MSDYFASVDMNRPEVPDIVTYTLTNTGIEPMTVAVAADGIDAITFGGGVRTFETELAAGESFALNVEVDLASVELGEQSGEIVVDASFAGGTQSHDIIARIIGYQGALPTERPLNDNFADAMVMRDNFQSAELTSFGATSQVGEPAHDGEDAESTTWYAVLFERDHTLRVRASGRLGRNTLAAYRGPSLAALESLASASQVNDDVSLDLTGTAGETVYIAFDYSPPENSLGGQEREPFTFEIIPLAADYDAFDGALALNAPGGRAIVSLSGASREDGEPADYFASGSGTIWLRATGTPGDRLSLTLEQSTSTITVQAFTGTGLDDLVAADTYSSSVFSEPDPFLIDIPEGGLWLRLQGISSSTSDPLLYGDILLRWQIGPSPAEANVRTAVAPMVRTSEVNGFSSALLAASIGGDIGAEACGILPPLDGRGRFTFMPLTPESGDAGDAVDIAAGQSQVFAFGGHVSGGRPLVELEGAVVLPMLASCANGSAAFATQLNSLILTLGDGPMPDLVAVSAATTGNVVEIPMDGVARFSVAVSNIGVASGPVYIVPFATASEFADEMAFAIRDAASVAIYDDFGFPVLPVDIAICPTDSETGTCTSGPAGYATRDGFGPGVVETYTVQITGQGADIALSPASNRIGVAFVEVPAFGPDGATSLRLIGATSIAVRTTDDAGTD